MWRAPSKPPAHDAFTRLLDRLEPDPATLWHEVEGCAGGRFHARQAIRAENELGASALVGQASRGGGGGINLITMVWTDGDATVPCDWRVFDKLYDGITKNAHFAAMLLTAKRRAFTPECVRFDSWYASIDGPLWAACACCETAAGSGSRGSAVTAA